MFVELFSDDGISLEPTEAIRQRNRSIAERHRAKGLSADHVDIFIKGQIDEQMVCDVCEALDRAPAAKSLDLIIDCKGGDSLSAAYIYKRIRDYPAETKTAQIVGACESGGLIIALAADHRTAGRKATFLIHQSRISGHIGMDWKAQDMQRMADQLTATDTDMFNLIAERTGNDVAVIAAIATDEEYTSIDWCHQNGIIHEIAEDQP